MTIDHPDTASGTAPAPLGDDELAAIAARLPVGGLFVAHAHTDMTRLLAEVHRLRYALRAAQDTTPTTSPPAYAEQGVTDDRPASRRPAEHRPA